MIEPSIKRQPEVMKLGQEPSWMDPIISYLRNDEVPKGKTEARVLRLKVARYVLNDKKPYRRGHSMPLLKCVPLSEAEYIVCHQGAPVLKTLLNN